MRPAECGTISLRRLNKHCEKLRKRVSTSEGYDYNWIVDELSR